MRGITRKPKVLIVCGGRLAGLLYSMFEGRYDFIGYIDDIFPRAYVEETYGLKNLGTSENLPLLAKRGVKAVVAVTDVAARRKYHELLDEAGIPLATLIAGTAVVSPHATIGAGCIIRHSAIVSSQAILSDNVVVSDGAYVGHDSTIGENVYISPGAHLNGSVRIGENTFVGTGAVVLPEVRVGRGCTIGASACVNRDIADDTVVAGVPARPLASAPRTPLVSVIMAAYNHEKYVASAIESVLAQTFEDFELVIIDDGSTDGTAGVIRRFTDPRIRARFSTKNGGNIFTKNKCLDMARGRYIAILNSDDAFMPDKLEKQVAFLDENPECAAVLSDAEIIDDDGNPFTDTGHFYYRIFSQRNRSRFEWLRRFFYEGNCLCIPSALIRRECYDVVGRPDPRYLQLPDLDFWIRTCFRYDIHVLQEKLTRFRVRDHRANASAPTREHVRQHVWEYSKILGRYLDIADERELLAIFPEAAAFSGRYGIEREMIPFVVARLAIKAGDRLSARAFALDTLYGLLGDATLARKIFERYGFGYKEFIDLTGRLASSVS
jgi:sugar O-acyltransferase (sialic acid O-acetyltransferase NeuD family)